MECGYLLGDGHACSRAGLLFDARGSRMLCREHAVAPLERVLGQRDDLEEKAEYVLRFLGLASQQRHEVLEALAPEERREFIHLTRLFESDQ